MNRLNAQQEALCRQYILGKIAQIDTHFTEITTIIDQFRQNSRQIEQEIIQEQAVVVAVASLVIHLRSQQFIGRIVPQNEQIAYYTERLTRYINGDETVRLPLRTRLYAVYYLQRQVNEALSRGQILTQTQESDYYRQMTRQYTQNIDRDITLQARMFADFKLQGHIMNSTVTLTETEKLDYYNVRQTRYLQYYQRYAQLTQNFILNISLCERTFIQRNTTIDNEFCQNMFGQVITSADLINIITTLVSDRTYELLSSLREIYNFFVGYYQSINTADVRNLEERLHPTTFMIYFLAMQNARDRTESLPTPRPGLFRRSRGPAPAQAPFGRAPPAPAQAPFGRAPFGRAQAPFGRAPFGRAPPAPAQAPHRANFWEENATPPPQPRHPPPPQTPPPQPRPQEEPLNEVPEEPCPAVRAKPQPPICWDRKIQRHYHPDKNSGCPETAKKLFQQYQSLNLPEKC